MTIQNLEKHTPISFYDVKDQLKEFIYARSDEAFDYGHSERDAIRSKEELLKRQNRIRDRFMDAIGGLPSSDTPLNAQITGTIQGDGFRIEKVIFESRPQSFVTANVYIPDNMTAPSAAVQFLCGHNPEAKHCQDYHTVCLYLVQAGLIVLVQDPVGQGERYSYYEKSIGTTTVGEGTSEHSYSGCQCLPVGDSAARYFLHDAMRGIDYLCSRPEVDPSRIGVTGSSGGGMQTCMMMMADSRIAAAAPGTFLSSRQTIIRTGLPQDAEQTWPGMAKWGFDHEDILLCMVPRPVKVLAVKYDFFPIEGTRKSVERAKRFWQMYGKEENLQLVEDDSVHRYTTVLAQAAAQFFADVLTDRQVAPASEDIHAMDPKALWCTNSGQVCGEIPGARFMLDENRERLADLARNRDRLPEAARKEQAWQWLKERIYNNRNTCELNVKHIAQWQVMDFQVTSSVWWSQQGLLNHALTFRSFAFAGRQIPVTIAVWDGGTTQIQPHIEWIRRTCEAGRAAIVLNTSGVGAILPDPLAFSDSPLALFGTIYKLADDLIWLDDSLAAMRTYDVLRAIDALKEWPDVSADDVQLYAHGRQGLYARWAAFADERARNICVEAGMASFSEWAGARHYDNYDIMSVILPGMLKFFDLPDLDRWTRPLCQ